MENKLSQTYLKPKNNAQVRVGDAFQANIPNVTMHDTYEKQELKHKDKVKVETNIKFEMNENIVSKEEPNDDIRPSKKRKLDC
jgi:hypothetical protein